MLKNQMLAQALAEVEKGVSNRDAFDKLVKAGTRIIYDKKVFDGVSQQILDSENPVETLAKGMTTVLHLMMERAKGTAPADALVQAGMALVIDALDFMEQAGVLKVNEATLDDATKGYIEALLPTVGLTEQKMAEALEQVKAVTDDPQKMAAYKAQAGSK
jgi:hypothetical protein